MSIRQAITCRVDSTPTLDYIVLALVEGHALRLMLIISHGDARDTLGKRPEKAIVQDRGCMKVE